MHYDAANTASPAVTVLSSRLPHDLAVAVAQLAREGDRSVSAEIRRAVKRHLAAERPPAA